MLRRNHSRLVAQELIHRRSIHNFTGIEDVFRIPGVFDSTEKLIVLFPHHQRNKCRAYPTVSMFAGQRTLVFLHQLGRCKRNLIKLLYILGLFQIQNRSHVDLTCSGVGIVNRILVESFQNLIQLVDVIRQVLDIHSSIFNTCYSLGVARNVAQESQTSCTKRPSRSHSSRLNDRVGIAIATCFQVVYKRLPFGHGFFQCFSPKLDHQNRLRITLDEIAVFGVFDTFLGTVQDDFIHQFHRSRRMLHSDLSGFHAFVDTFKMRRYYDFHWIWKRIEADFDFGGESQSSLRTRQQLTEVEFFLSFK